MLNTTRLPLGALLMVNIASGCATSSVEADAHSGGRADTGRVDSGGHGDDASTDASGAAADTGDDGGAADGSGSAVPWATLRIVPSDAVLTAQIGTSTTLPVELLAMRVDRVELPVGLDATWETSDVAIADVDTGSSSIQTSGRRAGEVEITATFAGMSAVGRYEVRLGDVEFGEGVDPAITGAFAPWSAAASSPQAPTWEYPADQTVMPAGIVPPVLQWAANGNRVYHLTLARGTHVRLDVYTRATEFQPTPEQWEALAWGFDDPIVLELSGKVDDAAPETFVSAVRTLHTADATLAGDVYYWQIETGDIMRIAQGETAPAPVFSTNADSGTCRGCHTLSRDGGRLGFMYNGGDNPRAGIAWVASPEPAVVENGSALQWTWFAWDASGRRGLGILSGQMRLWDVAPERADGPADLGVVASVNDGGRRPSHPAWSPDGSRVVYVSRTDSAADWDYGQGDLWRIDWDPVSASFGAPAPFISAPGGASDTLSHPTWTPDSQWVAYLQGPDNRDANPTALMLADATGGSTVRLANAAPSDDAGFPSFSPYRAGGYYWLLFYSPRPYGHLSTHKQLWVTAVDLDAAPGADPSAPAFWLPGQDTTRQNITGYWSPPVCTTDQACKDDADCCTGYACVREGTNDVCRASACTLPGEPCTDVDACCAGFVCAASLNGVPVCQPAFEP